MIVDILILFFCMMLYVVSAEEMNNSQCTCHVTSRRIRETIVSVESDVLHIFNVCL